MDGRKWEECKNIEQGIKNLLFSSPESRQNDSRNNNHHVNVSQRRPQANQSSRPLQQTPSHRGGGQKPQQLSNPQIPLAFNHLPLSSPPHQAPKPGNRNREYSYRGGGRRRSNNRTPHSENPREQQLFMSPNTPTPHLLSQMNHHSEESCTTDGEFKPAIPSKNQQKVLKENYIEVLQKPLAKSPEARYLCSLCLCNYTYYDKVRLHLKAPGHIRKVKEENVRKELQTLTFPSDEHLRAMTSCLEEVFQRESLSPQEEVLRTECQVALQSLLDCEPQLESCQVRLFDLASGSLLRSGEASFDLVLQKGDNPAVKLNLVFELLKKRSDIFGEVCSDLYVKHPRIMFRALQFDLQCSLYLMGNPSYFQTCRLLKDYVLFNPKMGKLSSLFHLLAKVCELDQQDKGALPPYAFPIMVIYFMQQYKPPLLPVLHHFVEEESNSYPNVERALRSWPQVISQPSLGELWIKLLRFYALDLDYSSQVVSIVTDRFVSIKEKNWAPRSMAIEEPFNAKRNLARSFATQEVFSFFLENICCAYKYFVKAQVISGGDGRGGYWTFDRKNFNPNMAPFPIFCGTCNKKGHLKEDCPDFKLPPLDPLPPLPPDYEKELTDVCTKLYYDLLPKQKDTESKNDLLNNLWDYIKQIYPDAILEIFGSSLNGFGFQKCDMDICLTFRNRTCEEMENPEVQKQVIETLAQHLTRNSPAYEQIIPITTAKVPIVKFKFKNMDLEADISLYNTLAKHNTELLRAYTLIDKRAQVLGFVLKHFAKLFEIGDASSGSLSSYAYILMVIYFLQQRKPPILPVLQELHPPSQPRPCRMVKEWDTWFFDDISKLKYMWPEGGQNKESIGHLLVEMFKFYTETFEFDKFVISIRQLKPMSRLDKLWSSKCIVIEDPFELTHNLGSGLTMKMDMYIKKAFIEGRSHFGIPPPPAHYQFRSLKNILFNKAFLTKGSRPPSERCCHKCHKIGHRAKDCQRQQPNNNNGNAGGGNFRRRVTRGPPPQGGGNNTDILLPSSPPQAFINPRHLPQQHRGFRQEGLLVDSRGLPIQQQRPSRTSPMHPKPVFSPHGPPPFFNNHK